MSTTTTRPVFTDTELLADDLANPFRPSGLVSLFFGFGSATALASTSLLVIPLFGLIFGLFALRPAKDPTVKPGGRVLAVLGIALSLLFGSWSWAYFNAQRNFLVSNGTQFAEQWLETLRDGHVEFAYELTQPKFSRQLETMPLNQYYSPENEMPYEQLQTFKTSPAVKSIIDAPADPVWKLQRIVETFTRYQQEHIVFAFEDTTGTVAPVVLILCCAPTVDSTGKVDSTKPFEWHVSEVAPAQTN